MSTFKKLLALTLALAMVLSVSAFAGTYSANTYKDAADIDKDAADAVELLYALDIMVGDENGNYNPTATITRAEMAKMIYVVLNYGNDDKAVNYTGAKIFSDVPAGIWYEGYVNFCATTKLVQGYQGKFNPTAPITCAEAAKMILTAVGYSAEARGYTGANWAQNVLSDATILGLLDGYKYNTNTYAPRQWVAVMFQNMLLDCLTFDTMRPTFSGLLTSGSSTTIGDYDTMGAKYYGLAEVVGTVIATYDAYIDSVEVKNSETTVPNGKTAKADEYEVLVYDGSEVYAIRGTGLGAADLGQEYRMIVKDSTSSKYDYTAYSVRSLSETAEARTLDMEVDVKYSTSSNKANNKYEFTIGEMTAVFEAYEINVLKSGVDQTSDGKPTTVNVDELRQMIKNDVNNNIWKAIDTDADGKIDYFYVTEFDYAQITDVDTHSKYGDYIVAEDLSDDDKLTFNKETRLYTEDCIITEDELEEDNVVKYTWSLDDGQFVMEVLEVSEEIEYAARDSKNEIYELDGTDFMIADEAVPGIANGALKPGNLGDPMDYAYDGDLLVQVVPSDSNYTDMADVNAQLVLVTDVRNQYSNSTIREQNAIEYMTIDGETHVAGYQDATDYVQFSELAELEDIQDTTKYDDDKSDWETITNGKHGYNIHKRLFILHEGTKGRVYLERLSNEGDDPNEQLDASTSILDGFDQGWNGDADALDAEGTTAKLNGNKFAADLPFFYGYFDGNGEAVYKVITSAELEKACSQAYYQVLTLDNDRGTRTTVVGGYVFTPNMVSDEAEGYLFIDEILKETSKNYYKAMVTMDDGTEAEISIKKTELIGDYEEGYLYAYDYVVVDDYYKLTMVDVLDTNEEIEDFDDDYVITDDNEYEMDDEVIAVVRVQVDRDENADEFDFERNAYDFDLVEWKFVAIEDLTAEMIADGEEPADGYVQFTDFVYEEDELMYVVVYEVMDRYLGQDLNDSPRVTMLGQVAKGDATSAKIIKNDTNKSYEVSLELENLKYAYSVDLLLFSGDEMLTFSSLDVKKYPNNTALTGRVMIEGTSGSWDTAEWTPDADVIPTHVELWIDGVCKDTVEVVKVYSVDDGTPDKLTAEDWKGVVDTIASWTAAE